MLYVALAGQIVLVAGAFWLETRASRDRRRSAARGALLWSGAWLALGLLPTLWFGLFDAPHAASSYAAVYLIERALSLDNVFVFAVLIATFEIPGAEQDRLVSYGALSAFALRVPAILLGVAVFDASHVVGYVLGGLLIVLAWQTARSREESAGANRVVAWLQRRLPVSEQSPRRWLVVRDGRREVTPLLLCLIAIVFADLTFAVDSIPAALAISNDTTLLLTANLLALIGLRALFSARHDRPRAPAVHGPDDRRAAGARRAQAARRRTSCTSARWKASWPSCSCSRPAPPSRCAPARRRARAHRRPVARAYSSPTWRRIDTESE